MARETRRSGETNDGQDLEMEKFIKDIANNTPNDTQFEEVEKKDE